MENYILIIGDVHGKVDEYYDLIKDRKDSSIQVGDFGFKKEHDWFIKTIDTSKHKINFGNHDYHPYKTKFHSTGLFSLKDDIMTISGAFSIDSGARREGVDWFRDEELNYAAMQKAIDTYIKYKPKFVISHDCPQEIMEQLFNIYDRSITTMGMQTMFDAHQPEKWIFGHYHQSKKKRIGGTFFRCLDEMETYELIM